MKTIVPILFAAIGLLAVAAPAEAGHGAVAFRNTPLRPFVGPVPARNVHNADSFVAPHAFHGVNAFRGYSLPFVAPSAFYAPAPVVYAQPAPVVTYTQPAPVVSTYQSYSASGYGAPAAYNASPQAFSAGAGVTYQLPDGRLVLPSGQVIEPR